MQEITGAKPVRVANLTVPKTFAAMHFFGMEASSVQLRVGAQFCGRAEAPQSSQRSGEHHKPAVPRAALGTATIYASFQQPVGFFCKEI